MASLPVPEIVLLDLFCTFPRQFMLPVLDHATLSSDRYCWYSGLPSCPPMVAHSANSVPYCPRSRVDSGYEEPKMLWPVDPQHPICAAWRAGLDEGIIDLLRKTLPTSWSVLPLRIGHFPDEAHTALYIAVEEKTATAEEGQEAVRCIVALLGSKHLDVDVEILESSYIKLGRLYNVDFSERPYPFSTHIVSPPSSLDCPLLSVLRFLPSIIPRHPIRRVSGSTRPVDSTLPSTSQSELCDPVPIGQFFGESFTESLDDCQRLVEIELRLHSRAREHVRQDSLHDASRTDYRQQFLEEAVQTLQRVAQDFGDPSQHIIGYSHALSNEHPVRFEGATWTCDWGLIRPDQDAFEGSTINEIPVTRGVFGACHAKKADLGWSEGGDFGPDLPEGWREGITLTGDAFDLATARDEARALVKIGARSGTQGCVNSVLEARVRLDADPCQPWTSQLVVFSLQPDDLDVRSFSVPADSGAAVVGRAGNVMGMVIGGQGGSRPLNFRQRVDLTFVTPIGAILEDLERMGFQDPIIAPGGLF